MVSGAPASASTDGRLEIQTPRVHPRPLVSSVIGARVSCWVSMLSVGFWYTLKLETPGSKSCHLQACEDWVGLQMNSDLVYSHMGEGGLAHGRIALVLSSRMLRSGWDWCVKPVHTVISVLLFSMRISVAGVKPAREA